MKRILMCTLLSLAACNPSNEAADGYAFGTPEYTATDLHLQIVPHDDLPSLRAAMPAGNEVEGREVMAWSRLYSDRCEVHIVSPAKTYLPEWIGHEIAHCIHGRWHG
mgnify:CR=1 FL=1